MTRITGDSRNGNWHETSTPQIMSKRPVRFFNTTGPYNPDDHYMLPPAERLIGAQLHRYVEDSLYWTLHAPRQTGKTTFLQSWMREINTEAKAGACYISVETNQGVSVPAEAMPNTTNYTKAFSHLLLMAFLQRITNGDGRIKRKYTAGRRRMDLLVEYAGQKLIIEIKLARDYETCDLVFNKGLEQIASYSNKINREIPSYLIIFDQRTTEKRLPWKEPIWGETQNNIYIVGCRTIFIFL